MKRSPMKEGILKNSDYEDDFNLPEQDDDQGDDQLERAIDAPDVPEADEHTNRTFYIIAAAIVVIFFGIVAYQQFSTPTGALTFDDLHQLNIDGKLDEEKGYLYNAFSFVFFDGLWYTNVVRNDVNYRVPLHFGPRDLENVQLFGNLSYEFNVGTDIYVVVNPISEGQDYIALAASELAQNLAVAIKRRPVGACDRNETGMCEFRPIVTCETTDHAMIYLLQEPGPLVELKDTCIILRGVDYDLVKAVDRLVLQWYGIM